MYGMFPNYGTFDYGYLSDVTYGATDRKCARLLKKLDKKEAKIDRVRWKGRKRRLKRRASLIRSRLERKGCTEATSILANSSALLADEEQEVLDLPDPGFDASPVSVGSNSTTWLIGGVAVLGVLAFAYRSSK